MRASVRLTMQLGHNVNLMPNAKRNGFKSIRDVTEDDTWNARRAILNTIMAMWLHVPVPANPKLQDDLEDEEELKKLASKCNNILHKRRLENDPHTLEEMKSNSRHWTKQEKYDLPNLRLCLNHTKRRAEP